MSTTGLQGGTVPIGPWREWITTGPYARYTHQEVGRLAEVDEAVVRRWRTGGESSVYLDIVDRTLCNMGQPGVLNDLYPACACCGAYVCVKVLRARKRDQERARKERQHLRRNMQRTDERWARRDAGQYELEVAA